MPLDVNAATARLARQMHEAEDTISDALVAATSLMQTAALASRDISEAPVIQSQAALLHLNKLRTGLIDARGEALRVHGQLLDAGREMGATESPYCPPRNASKSEPSQKSAA